MIAAMNLPWPRRELHPNARVHWQRKALATKRARSEGFVMAFSSGLRRMAAERLRATITFAPPDLRRRDADGVLASLKPALDGIADAIGVDDSRWDFVIRRAAPIKGGNIKIELQVIE